MKFMNRLWLPLAVVLVVALYSKFQRAPTLPTPAPSAAPVALESPRGGSSDSESTSDVADTSESTARPQATDAPFRCDGRTYCSQMTSCAEAKYFLEHCPNVKMDGDHDGVPCESQWCPNG